MQLSPNFSLVELTVSQEAARRGIPNAPDIHQLGNLRALCAYVLQPLREHVGKPIVVTSGFRSASVNAMVGGARTSEHIAGLAADIIIPGMSPADVCKLLAELRLPCRQIILEFERWSHVSLALMDRPPQLLTAAVVNGKTIYTEGIA